jgi:hypothetical protein
MTTPSPKLPVILTIEEIKGIRDAVNYHRQHLQKCAASTDVPLEGAALEIIEAKIFELEVFHQRLVGIVCLAEQKERELR